MADGSTLHSTGGVRLYTRGLGRRVSKATSAGRRKKAPFRRTFDSASSAAERFHAENIDFLQPILDHGEPREAVREWLRSNAHGRTGRMRVKDLSQTPWAAKMLASADPVKGALRNVFGHAEGRRWDRVDWDAIRALGETLAEFASKSEGAGPGGWTWFPIAIEDDDAKILDRLSVEGEPDAYRQFAASLSSREVDAVVATYEREVERLARCMPKPRRRHVEARLAEIRRWKSEGIPESVCGQGVYAGHTCDLEPLHGELKRLRDACESDAAYAAWRNEAVRRSPRQGSAAEGEGDDIPLDIVPVAAFDGHEPVAAEPCTPSEAARVMARLGVAKRRENAARRKKIREANAAERAAERKQVSQARKEQREASRRRSGGKGRGMAPGQSKQPSLSEPSPSKEGALPGVQWEFSKSRDAWRLLNVHGYQVAAMNHGASGIWIAFVHPPGKKAPRVRIDDDAKVPVAKRKVERAVLDAMSGEWWTDLRGDHMFPPGISRKVLATERAEMKARGRGRRVSTPCSDMSRMTTATLQAELFELEGQLGTGSWSKARADAHHASIGAAMDELFARGVFESVRLGSGSTGSNDRSLQLMSEDEVDNAFRGKDPRFAAPRWLATNLAYVLEELFTGGGLTLVRGPRSKTSGRAESLYVLRKGALLAYRGRRARVTVRQHGGYYTVEVEGMPKGVVDLVVSAVREVMADPKLGMRDQGGGLSWRRT